MKVTFDQLENVVNVVFFLLCQSVTYCLTVVQVQLLDQTSLSGKCISLIAHYKCSMYLLLHMQCRNHSNRMSTGRNSIIITTTTTTTVLRSFFRDHPGEPVPEEKLVDFMVQGKINRGRHTDHPAGCHSIRTNQCPAPPSPIFTGRMPFLPPKQQCSSSQI